jgi:hypothetical protein
MDFLANMEEMNVEHEAWQDVVREFQARGIDVNAPEADSLIKSITRWGEELVALRVKQNPSVIETARNEKRGLYFDTRREA